jgi:hypothetical protein
MLFLRRNHLLGISLEQEKKWQFYYVKYDAFLIIYFSKQNCQFSFKITRLIYLTFVKECKELSKTQNRLHFIRSYDKPEKQEKVV